MSNELWNYVDWPPELLKELPRDSSGNFKLWRDSPESSALAVWKTNWSPCQTVVCFGQTGLMVQACEGYNELGIHFEPFRLLRQDSSRAFSILKMLAVGYLHLVQWVKSEELMQSTLGRNNLGPHLFAQTNYEMLVVLDKLAGDSIIELRPEKKRRKLARPYKWSVLIDSKSFCEDERIINRAAKICYRG